jgi:hypothetical protein
MSDEQFREGHSSPISEADDYHLRRRFTREEFKANKRHLRMLSGCYYLIAAALMVMGGFLLLYVGGCIAAVSGALDKAPRADQMKWVSLFIGILVVIDLLIWAMVGCFILAGRSLVGRQRYIFCVVMAALVCVLPPLGTILGLCTMLVLMRESVKELFMNGEFAFQPDSKYD